MTDAQALDFRDIADAVVRNNMGVAHIDVQLSGTLQNGAVAARNGQRWPLAGAPADNASPWQRFVVEGFADGELTWRWLGGQDRPQVPAAAAPAPGHQH